MNLYACIRNDTFCEINKTFLQIYTYFYDIGFHQRMKIFTLNIFILPRVWCIFQNQIKPSERKISVTKFH